MKRITTNDENHILASLNLFYCKDNELWVRHGGPEPDYPDATLVDVIREIAKAHDLAIEAEGPESLGDEMYDAMFDGVSTVEGVVALFHAAAVQAAEMQGRLKAIEDILGEEYELDGVRELVDADREGRYVVMPAKTVFELTWDVGPECDMACPMRIDGEGQCDFCDKGKLFVYEHPCKQEHIERLGKDVFLTRAEAEAALKARKQDD